MSSTPAARITSRCARSAGGRCSGWRKEHCGNDPRRRAADHRSLRPAPVEHDRRAAVDQRRTGAAREDALLFLRPAVRHPVEGARQPGDWLRAVGGVSVQPRHALPERRQALPAGIASGSPAHGAGARPVVSWWIQCAAIRRCDQAHGGGDRPPAVYLRRRFGRRARWRQPDDREDLPAGQVRARVPEDAVHRLQRPPVHGERRRREQEGVRRRPRHQSLGGHDRHRGDLGRRLECRGVLADHDQLSLAGTGTRREDHHPGSEAHAHRAHLRPVPSGEAWPRCRAVCRCPPRHDREGLDRSRLHRRQHRWFRCGRELLRSMDTGRDRARDGRSRALDHDGRRDVGDRAERLHAACARHRASLQRRAEYPWLDQPRAGNRASRQAPLRLRHHRRPGQWAGRPRARAEMRSAAGPAGHFQS